MEAVNGKILRALKKRLEDAKTGWVGLMLEVLRDIRTTAHSTIDEAPFNLTYGAEVVILVKIGMNSAQVKNFNSQGNNLSI